MNQSEFFQKMGEIDAELIKRKIPVRGRPFKALDLFCPNSSFILSPDYSKFFGEFEGPNLFEKIQQWYEDRYGDKMLSDFKAGKQPFLLRGEIYYIRYPLIYGGPREIYPINYVEGLTDTMKASLSSKELEHIFDTFELGYHTFDNINSLLQLIGPLRNISSDILRRGITDINAVTLSTIDYQNSVFHAHQASEKFLKVLWVELNQDASPRKGKSIEEKLKDFGHNISQIYGEIGSAKSKLNQSHRSISPSVRYLKKLVPDMDIRYKDIEIEKEQAIGSVEHMLKICGYVSRQIVALPQYANTFFPPKN